MTLYIEIAIALLLLVLIVIEYKRFTAQKQVAATDRDASGSAAYKRQKTTHNNMGCTFLESHIDEEVSKLQRYSSYGVTLMNFSMNADPADILHELRDFIRKSDRIFVCEDKVYIFFPFIQDDQNTRIKIENRIVGHLEKQLKKKLQFTNLKFQRFEYDPQFKRELIAVPTQK